MMTHHKKKLGDVEEAFRTREENSCRRKVAYTTAAFARRAAKDMRKVTGRKLQDYQCDFCGRFHTGNRGVGSRETLNQKHREHLAHIALVMVVTEEEAL